MSMISTPIDRSCAVTFSGVAVSHKLVELIRQYTGVVDAALQGHAQCRRVSLERSSWAHDALPVRAEVRVALCGGAAEFSLSRYGRDEPSALRHAFERVAEHLGIRTRGASDPLRPETGVIASPSVGLISAQLVLADAGVA